MSKIFKKSIQFWLSYILAPWELLKCRCLSVGLSLGTIYFFLSFLAIQGKSAGQIKYPYQIKSADQIKLAD